MNNKTPAEEAFGNLSIDTDKDKKREQALKKFTTKQLIANLSKQLNKLNAEGAMLLSEELTQRGVAPCFRYLDHQGNLKNKFTYTLAQQEEFETKGSVVIDYDDQTDDLTAYTEAIQREFILLCSDLQWLTTKYPKHKTEWQRLQIMFEDKNLKPAKFLHWGGRRTSGQIAKALSLTEQQQRECGWIECLYVERWRVKLFKRLPTAKARIELTIREKDKRPATEQDITISRRTNLWLCAELAKWKPQRTAEFFTTLTGELITRQSAFKQMDKLPKISRTDTQINPAKN